MHTNTGLPPQLVPERASTHWLRLLEILSLHASGLTNRQVASALCLSEETIRSHAQRIKTLLGAANVAHAVALGFRYGLIDRETIQPVERAAPTPTSTLAA